MFSIFLGGGGGVILFSLRASACVLSPNDGWSKHWPRLICRPLLLSAHTVSLLYHQPADYSLSLCWRTFPGLMYLRLGLLPRTAVRQRTQGTAWHEQITSRETIYITILMSFTCVFSGKGGGGGGGCCCCLVLSEHSWIPSHFSGFFFFPFILLVHDYCFGEKRLHFLAQPFSLRSECTRNTD